MTDLTYFSQFGKITDPGPYVDLYAGLPSDIPSLVRVVQGLIVHVFWAERYGLRLTGERQAEVQLRSMERRIERTLELDSGPLTTPRSLDRRIVGNCRDFSVTLASMLQSRGIPARPRCGFGAYFLLHHYEDHWVCEYWNDNEQRWILVDAQLDELQRTALGTSFDTLDVPRDQFIVGGAAWKMCRSGQADPNQFGIFDMHGMDFVKGDFIRDVAALNKVELLPWDCWGLILDDYVSLPADDLSLLDHLADLTYSDVPEFDRVRQFYESDPRLQVGSSIQSYVNGAMERIQL
ncbi:MAG TPA: transglutaminase-like domain-containing protein [Anaerolineales bacterium]|nr:transglutaminase-like domain-containing protein [Anaerolineales bacterium]